MIRKRLIKLMCGAMTMAFILGACGKDTDDGAEETVAETPAHEREEKKE